MQRATTISEQHIGKRGENPLFLVWFNHSKIVEDAALKLALVKGTHPHMPGDLWFCIIVIIEKSHITTFTKAFRLQISYKKEQNKTHLLFRFKDYMWMLYPEINLSLYVPRVYFFFHKWGITESFVFKYSLPISIFKEKRRSSKSVTTLWI